MNAVETAFIRGAVPMASARDQPAQARHVGGVLAPSDPRVERVRELGFTERQARFLVVAMLHSGVCMLRQYTGYAGIVHGQKTRLFGGSQG